MEYIYLAVIPALWLGILTSISPCPMATNIAAISFIGKKVGSKRAVLLSGLLYTTGRMFAYLAVAAIIVASLLSVPEVARFLQEYINIIMGPLLIIVGLFLLNIFGSFTLGNSGFLSRMGEFAERKGGFGAFLLGLVFALAFCPVSAGLFFGSLLPLSIKYESAYILPLLYGLGTALPVVVFAIIIAFGAQYLGKVFDKITTFEKWAQKITGAVFIIIGIYLSYLYIF